MPRTRTDGQPRPQIVSMTLTEEEAAIVDRLVRAARSTEGEGVSRSTVLRRLFVPLLRETPGA